MKKYIVVLLVLLGTLFSAAQVDTIPEEPILASDELSLVLIQKMYKDSVVLRWAPTRIDGWITGMNNGYRIQKLELNDKMEPVGDWDTLVTNIIKPYSIEKFKQVIADNPDDNFLAAAAESMYGFQLEYGNNIKDNNLFELAEEYKDRFSICLLSADLSARGAQGLGWRFVDRKIKLNTKYVYRVYTPGKDTVSMLLDNSIIAEADSLMLEAPLINDILEKEGQIDLQLSRELNDRYFSAYYIERSDNGGDSWNRLTNVPFVQPLTDHKIGNKDYIIYRDTGLVNYEPHLYRVVGITSFGEISKPSDIIEGKGKDRTPPRIPNRIMAKMNDDQKMEVKWEYDVEPDDIKGFVLARSMRPFDPQVPIHEGELPGQYRRYLDENPNTIANNFYTLYVVDTASNISYTQATYGSYIDSFPPEAPTGFEYKIDKKGRASLSWNLGKEEDLLGYHVYFANSKQHRLHNVTHLVLQDTVFLDTFDLKSLTEFAYYRVTALDFNYNVSEFSEWIEVIKPDIVAPSSPVITNHKATQTGIEILFEQSSSKDVVSHILFRQESSDSWKEIASKRNSQLNGSLTDNSNLIQGKLYRYRVAAMDDAGNLSKPTFNYTARTRLPVIKGEIESFDVKREKSKGILSWTYIGRDNDIVKVYRAENGNEFHLLRSYNASDRQGKDYTLRDKKNVEYRLMLETRDGIVLDMAEAEGI